jgi:DNA-binding transcriptional regulator YiaG
MTPEQCRAARAWLNWSQQQLSERAHVGSSTVRDFEAGRRQPIANNIMAMRRAIEAAGIVFMFDLDGRATGIAIADAGASRTS